MKKLGLIGYPLSHSFSKKYFSDKFRKEKIENFQYELYPLKNLVDLSNLLNQESDLIGLNVTIPYKQEVIPFLDELSPEAKSIGAVNTIKIKNGRLTGYNTDYIGFKNSLVDFLKGKKVAALVLGVGGASKAVCKVLNELGIPFKKVSRSSTKGISYTELFASNTIIEEHKLIINCTPLGTFPDIQTKPEIPYKLISKDHYLMDLVYNPEITAFMQAGLDKGCKVKNGYDMLVGQAEAAWKIWMEK